VYSEVSQRAKALFSEVDADFFSNRNIGVEKETLRIDENGRIAQTDHPAELGSALCNSQITTDFSEALLEMVTPPCKSADEALDYLTGIHHFILSRLPESESLWNTSMPCVIGGDDSIRIGNYGPSHKGTMKQAYRRGLGLRYGRRMQAIAGVHFNFSLPMDCWTTWDQMHSNSNEGSVAEAQSISDFEVSTSTRGYFHMTRNMMRVGWLVPYLFGASPAICQTFLPSGQDSDLETLNKSTRYAPFGTSLRMGEIGYRYKEDSPIDLSVRHDRFEHYVDDILAHVTTPHPAYEAMGVCDGEGAYQQLNANRLQIENEYYSSVRPKQIPEDNELPILALRRAGIRYLELRSVDVNLFDPAGMHKEQLAMLEMLMLFSWFADSPPLSQAEMDANKQNIKTVAHRGREVGLKLQRGQENVLLQDWGLEVLDSLAPVAEFLDKDRVANGLAPHYQVSLQMQADKLRDSDLTPSARIVSQLDEHGSFFGMAMSLSAAHHEALLEAKPDEKLQAKLQQSVSASIKAQAILDANTTGSFGNYLEQYFSQLNSVNTASA